MVQNTFLDDRLDEGIVNVASVPQRSPFRYPGGKTWLVPRIRQWLASLPAKPHEFIEPFAGGGIVSLTVAFEDLAQSITMVELDSQVAAVWETILGGHAKWLAERVLSFVVTQQSVEAELARCSPDVKERAFQTLVKNRVYHGGILAPGSGLIKHGENGKGIKSRWYPGTLAKRILDIERVAHKVRFVQGDGLEVLRQNAYRQDVVFFIDPPYTAGGKRAGTRLYTHNQLEHAALFNIAETLAGDFLMTYDNADDVMEMARAHRFDMHSVPMMNTHHAAVMEVLIGRNLDWARGFIHRDGSVRLIRERPPEPEAKGTQQYSHQRETSAALLRDSGEAGPSALP